MTLLEESDIRRLRLLRQRFSRHALPWTAGDAPSRGINGTGEPQDCRTYALGDDVRKLDWFATARRGQPMVRTSRAEEDAVIHFLLDCSASLGVGAPPKFRCELQLCASLGYLALQAGYRVRLLVPTPTSYAEASETLRGTAATPQWVRSLEAATCGGGTYVASALQRLAARGRPPGRYILVSDFLLEKGMFEALSGMRARRHDLLLAQVYARSEFAFAEADGSVILRDSEDGTTLSVALDARSRAQYQATFVQWARALDQWCQRARARYLLVPSDEPFLDSLNRLASPHASNGFDRPSLG